MQSAWLNLIGDNMPILDFNKRTQSLRSIVMNDSVGFCTGDDFPWEEWENVPYGSRYFRANGEEWKKTLSADIQGPEGWELSVVFSEDVGKDSFPQALHGFQNVGYPIPCYIDILGQVRPAIATSRDTICQLFVKSVININELELYSGSNIIKFPNHTLQIGKMYYTSSTVPGGITTTPPSNFVNPLYVAVDNERILVVKAGQSPSPSTSVDLPICKVVNSTTCVNLISKKWTLLRDLDTFEFNDSGEYVMPNAGKIVIPADGRYRVDFNPHVYSPFHRKEPEYCIVISGLFTTLRSVSSPISGVLDLAGGTQLSVYVRTANKKGRQYLREPLTTSLTIQQLR